MYRPITIPLPARPTLPSVKFENKNDGVWLSYQDARRLATRELLQAGYIKKLEIRIKENNKLAAGGN
jgi:hypothetical protein